ncbi:MAG TPA: type VII secretion protein EssC [Negativicutes bacterium]|nr:type VII secretion protein EssC [Negativicutes bacterium]
MEDLLLHVYSGSRFIEIDPKKYSKASITLGGAGADIFIDSNNGRIVIDKDEDGLSIRAEMGFEVVLGGRQIGKKSMAAGDMFSVTLPGSSISIAAIMAKKSEDYPTPTTSLSITERSKIRIGRGEQNNIQIKDRMVSEDHAIIKTDHDGFIIEDTDSKNGTYVNGVRIKSKRLSDDDLITISGHKMHYLKGTLIVANNGYSTIAKGLPVVSAPGNGTQARDQGFQRSPRLLPSMPAGEIEIPAPHSAASEPTINWLTVLLPAGAMILIMILITIISPGLTILYVILPLMSALTAILSYRSQKKKFTAELETQESDYRQTIEKKRSEIKALQEQQKNAMQQMNPDTRAKMAIVRERQRRMWERTPAHADFLSFRLGIGEVPFTVRIKTPKIDEISKPGQLLSEAVALKTKYGMIPNTPVVYDLKKASPMGIIGKREDVLGAARNLVMDVATHHSYDEVKIVMVFPEHEKSEWESFRWIPHVFDNDHETRYMACDKRSVKNLFARLYEEIKLRELALKSAPSKEEMQLPIYLFLIGSQELVQNETLMSYLLHPQKEMGVFSVMLFDAIEKLPKDCLGIVSVENNAGKLVKYENEQRVFIADKTAITEADLFSRGIAPVRLRKIVDPSNLPTTLSFLEMYKVQLPQELEIDRRWMASEPYTGLVAPVGVTQNGQLQTINIGEGTRSYGWHGLVAGTIGSGKSEFLQTLILSLAVNYRPQDVAFVLIDYKGGAMANAFMRLPHLAGIITNLGGNQTDRALISINSEIRRRQAAFDKVGVNHINDYQRKFRNGEVIEPLPHLFIIVDEFAELKSEKPEFISGLVTASRVGRSLGIKLILATQKPSGVVDEQIKGNTGYSICLKVQSSSDSKEMLDRPDAALINSPGRAYIRVGADHIYEMFQAAWSGAEYSDKKATMSAFSIREVDLDGSRHHLSRDLFQVEYRETHSQLQVIVAQISIIAQKQGIPKVRSIWMPPLPERLFLELMQNVDKPVIGLVDDPGRQMQYPLEVDFIKNGHLSVFGAPSSGKTTLLKTMIVSICKTYSPDECCVYAIDFGSRALGSLEDFPNVGGVVMVDEAERLKNLLKFILKQIDQRKTIFSNAGVSNITSYRLTKGCSLAMIVLLIDNYPALLEIYPETEELMVQITREGSNLGVFVVLTANTPGAVKYRIAANFKISIALQMADRGDYSTIVGRTTGLDNSAPYGRGLIRDNPPLEFQTALPISGDDEGDRTENLRKLAVDLNKSWNGAKAEEIPEVPKKLTPEMLIAKSQSLQASFSLPLGIDFETVAPLLHNFREEEHLLIAGNARSGKSTFLNSIIEVIGLMDCGDVYIFDSRFEPLSAVYGLSCVKGYASGLEESEKLLNLLSCEIGRRKKGIKEKKASEERDIFIVIDNYHDFNDIASQAFKNEIESIVKRERGLKIHILLSGLTSDMASGWEGYIKAMRESQTGVLFAGINDQQVFNARASYLEASKTLKLGEAYYIYHGSVKKIKTASRF